jgi:hypothetical protein
MRSAIDWAERALRVGPIDRLAFAGHQAVAIGNFIRAHYEEAEHARRVSKPCKPMLATPSKEVCHE